MRVGGTARRILTVSESGSRDPKSAGDLYIDVVPAERYAGGYAGPSEKEIKEQRVTVHGSDWREQQDNRINLHLKFKDGTEGAPSTHYTKAILQGRFAPLYTRCYPNLQHARYDVPPRDHRRQVISLGEYDPLKFVMVFAVFVGPSGRQVADPPSADYSIKNLAFTKFSVVVMWSFIGHLASTDSGFVAHFFTEQGITDPNYQNFQDWLMNGVDEEGCKTWFVMTREIARHGICLLHLSPADCVQRTRFFRDGL